MRSPRLNIGCGENSLDEFVNLDQIGLPNVDVVWNLEKTPLPFKSNSFSEIRCDHILEHVRELVPLLVDLHRISVNGAEINITAPYYKYEGAYRDPTHVRFFTEHSFDYFQKGAKFSHYCPAEFNVLEVELRNRFFSDVKDIHKKIIPFIPFKPFLNKFMWNMYSEIRYKLEVKK